MTCYVKREREDRKAESERQRRKTKAQLNVFLLVLELSVNIYGSFVESLFMAKRLHYFYQAAYGKAKKQEKTSSSGGFNCIPVRTFLIIVLK